MRAWLEAMSLCTMLYGSMSQSTPCACSVPWLEIPNYIDYEVQIEHKSVLVGTWAKQQPTWVSYAQADRG